MTKGAYRRLQDELAAHRAALSLLLDVVEVTIKGPGGKEATISAGQLLELSRALNTAPERAEPLQEQPGSPNEAEHGNS